MIRIEHGNVNMEGKSTSFCMFFPISFDRTPHSCFLLYHPLSGLESRWETVGVFLAEIQLISRESNSFNSKHIYLSSLYIRHSAGHRKHEGDMFLVLQNLGQWESSVAWASDKLTLPGRRGNLDSNKYLILRNPLKHHFTVVHSCAFKIMAIFTLTWWFR